VSIECGLPLDRRGVSLVDVLVAASLMGLLLGVSMGLLRLVEGSSRRIADRVQHLQQSLVMMEDIRCELASLHLNPLVDPRLHEGNSFRISRPNGTSIQFVNRQDHDGKTVRRLVSYQVAAKGVDDPGMVMTKSVWEFHREGAWNHRLPEDEWPESWVGRRVEHRQEAYGLRFIDFNWDYLVPVDDEGQVFFRVRAVIDTGRAPFPLTWLVPLAIPPLMTEVSDCPCYFADCFERTRDPHCCDI